MGKGGGAVSSTTAVVTIMAMLMIVAGVVIARVSTRERGMGVVVAVLGAMLLVAYLMAEPGAPGDPGPGTPLPPSQEATP